MPHFECNVARISKPRVIFTNLYQKLIAFQKRDGHTYRISSKSRRGEILFQGSVWCGDNSRAARFRGRRLQRSIRTHVHSFNNKPSCMHVKCPCAYGNFCRPLTMRRDFEGGVYWDEMADRCGDISRAAGFRGAARFRGNTVATTLVANLWPTIHDPMPRAN